MELIIKELHNYSSSETSGVLSPSDNTLFYIEKAAITTDTYKSLFKFPHQCGRRLAILKISYRDDCGKRYVIWRAANTKGITGINDASIGLSFEAIWELNATKNIKNGDNKVEVTKGRWFPFFWFHPNHAARISTRIGLFSIFLAICSIILSSITLC